MTTDSTRHLSGLEPTAHEAPAEGSRSPVAHASIAVVRDVSGLEARAKDLDDLALAAIDPNPYFEPWMLLPALYRFARGTELELVIVTRKGGLVIGFFPLVRARRFLGLPIETLSLWSHDYCPLSTPLLRQGYAREAVDSFLSWLASDAGATLFELERIRGDGPFAHLFIDTLNDRGEPYHSVERHSRGLNTPRADADAYLAEILDGDDRRRLRTKERRLRELGRVEHEALEPGGDVSAWCEEFLALEASGWKGQESTAMGSVPENRTYFKAAMTEAFGRSKLEMLALRLDGRAIAMKCNLLSGCGAFCFKIAYEERYAKHSPGMLLELEQIRRLHSARNVLWLDSCSNTRSRLFRESCNDRRGIETMVLSTGSERGRLFVSLLAFARWVKRYARRLGRAQGSDAK